ncbi:imm11 family protein [Vibrio sp. VPAP30]|uniref:imm11 family protein n=1 Tax=Vibrio sp. VPAP30 TaxID=1647102 RepID=UPI00065A5D66|nr:DUF1629 domain-containing protein [Vibrio sp. VPAP30]KLN63069.1 hypothetical protein ZX61_22340 [Vibrio sp. VPAP30]
MKNYNDEYYIIEQDYSFEENAAYPSESSSNFDYDYDELVLGTKPLKFHAEISDVGDFKSSYIFLYDGPSFLVNTDLKEKIDFGLYGSQFFPAIIVGEDKGVRDDFWVLNTYDMLDALDESKSDIKTISESVDGLSMSGSVLKYSLNFELLSSIPEEERLIFKMSNTSTEPVFVHEKIVRIFRKLSVEGVKFYKVSEYEFGDEF